MTIRALFLSAAVTITAVGAAGCTKPGGKVLATTMAYEGSSKTWVPLVEYRAPDIDELTGITPPDETDEPEPAPTPAAAPTPAPAAPIATPAAAPAPAKPTTPAAKPTPAPAKPTTPATPPKTPTATPKK